MLQGGGRGCVGANRWSATASFEKLVGLSIQRLGKSDKCIQRDIVFRTFHTTDKRPVHVGSFREGLLRQAKLLPKLANVLSENLALRVSHAPEVCRKMVGLNIDYDTICHYQKGLTQRRVAPYNYPVGCEAGAVRWNRRAVRL